MPCYSTVKTKIKEKTRLIDALEVLGYRAEMDGADIYATKDQIRMTFRKAGDFFSVGGNTRELSEISRKYAEIGIREWARRKGYGITENDGIHMTLVNRRG